MKKTTVTLLMGSLALATAYGADDLSPFSKGVAEKRAQSMTFRQQLFAGADKQIKQSKDLHEQETAREKVRLEKEQQENQQKLEALVESIKNVSFEKTRLMQQNEGLEKERQRLEAVKAQLTESRARNVGALQDELEQVNQNLETLMEQKVESDKEVSKLSNSEALLKMQLEALRKEQQYLFANLGGVQPIPAPNFGNRDNLLGGGDSDSDSDGE